MLSAGAAVRKNTPRSCIPLSRASPKLPKRGHRLGLRHGPDLRASGRVARAVELPEGLLEVLLREGQPLLRRQFAVPQLGWLDPLSVPSHRPATEPRLLLLDLGESVLRRPQLRARLSVIVLRLHDIAWFARALRAR